MKNGPNVLVAGFSRCASTYLFHLLKQHPDIYIPKEKEVNFLHKKPHFLSHPQLLNLTFLRSRGWYSRKFDTEKPIKMDFSVMTAYDLMSAERVKNDLGDIKIIFLTRNKKDHQKSLKMTMKNHGEIVKVDFKPYSNFEKYMKPYRENFSNVLVISKEELAKNTKQALKKIFKFLELSEIKIEMGVHQNKSATYHEYRYLSRLSYPAFRLKRNTLKATSYVLTAFSGYRQYR